LEIGHWQSLRRRDTANIRYRTRDATRLTDGGSREPAIRVGRWLFFVFFVGPFKWGR